MIGFSKDIDILRLEPVLFGELHFGWQVLAAGEGGELAGTTFSKSGEDFVSAGVAAGGVIYLRSDGVLDGPYEIVSVDSASELTVSVVRADEQGAAVAPPAGSDVSFRISTFAPQANEVLLALTQFFGLRPGQADGKYAAEDVLEPDVLRRASVYAVLAAVYATLASRAEVDTGLWQKSHHYQRLYEQARRQCRVSIDTDSDGQSDITKRGGSVKLVRE